MFKVIEQLIRKAQDQKLDNNLEGLRKKYNYSKKDNYYRFLYYLVKEYQPAISVEIGVDFGVGCAFMVEAAKEYSGLVIGIDIDEKPDCEIQRLKKLENGFVFLNYSSLSEDTERILQSAIQDYGSIGLVYQDSSHRYLDSKKEWDLISPMCKDRAIWICDDITSAFYDPLVDPFGKGMCQYFEEIKKDKRIYQDILHYGNCQGVVII